MRNHGVFLDEEWDIEGGMDVSEDLFVYRMTKRFFLKESNNFEHRFPSPTSTQSKTLPSPSEPFLSYHNIQKIADSYPYTSITPSLLHTTPSVLTPPSPLIHPHHIPTQSLSDHPLMHYHPNPRRLISLQAKDPIIRGHPPNGANKPLQEGVEMLHVTPCGGWRVLFPYLFGEVVNDECDQ